MRNPTDTTNALDGDLARAVARLKELTERASSFLDATAINVISYTMAAHLDYHSQQWDETARMSGELDAEQKAIGQAWRNMGREIGLDGGRT